MFRKWNASKKEINAMFNMNFSFLNLRRRNRRKDILPMDFGAMYFLYPMENADCVGFGTSGILEKIVDGIKSRLIRKNDDVVYYKNQSFF